MDNKDESVEKFNQAEGNYCEYIDKLYRNMGEPYESEAALLAHKYLEAYIKVLKKTNFNDNYQHNVNTFLRVKTNINILNSTYPKVFVPKKENKSLIELADHKFKLLYGRDIIYLYTKLAQSFHKRLDIDDKDPNNHDNATDKRINIGYKNLKNCISSVTDKNALYYAGTYNDYNISFNNGFRLIHIATTKNIIAWIKNLDNIIEKWRSANDESFDVINKFNIARNAFYNSEKNVKAIKIVLKNFPTKLNKSGKGTYSKRVHKNSRYLATMSLGNYLSSYANLIQKKGFINGSNDTNDLDTFLTVKADIDNFEVPFIGDNIQILEISTDPSDFKLDTKNVALDNVMLQISNSSKVNIDHYTNDITKLNSDNTLYYIKDDGSDEITIRKANAKDIVMWANDHLKVIDRILGVITK